MPGLLAVHARVRGDRVALREKRLGVWREITWRGYYEHVRAAAAMLAELGVRPGDHVAILSDNRVEWLYADLAAQALGARSVGIYQTNPAADVAYILQDSGSSVLFCEDQEQVDKAVAIAAETPSVKHVVVFDPRGTSHLGDARLMPWEDFLARGKALVDPAFDERLAKLDPAVPSMVVYTSGTTGPPKGAMISSRNILEVAQPFQEKMGFTDRDTVLSYLPLCHVAEKIVSMFTPLTSGAVVHFGESLETVQTDLREVSPTIFLGVPRIWEKMNAGVTVKMLDSSWLKRTLYKFFTRRGIEIAKRRNAGTLTAADRLVWALGDFFVFRSLQERLGLRRCRWALTGAAPISADLIRWYHGIGVGISEGYGQTECGGISHINLPGANRIGTVGTSVPLVEHRLADDGEILVRGPNVFCGYLNQPEATAATIDADGWLHTGDIGEIDRDGYLTITGRKKDIIITAGGKNLSPEKIENALKTSPYIKEAISIGDRRKFVGALVQIELDNVGNWATRRGLPYTSYADLAAKPEVIDLVKGAIEAANELLVPVEQVKAFKILPKELSQDDGELTATQKVRRREVMATFGDLIESMYGRASGEKP
ncbi:MAG: AMP-binding protein [Myxococcota bacterium]|nr:AMP-binding protein [Myxococcota bacterium]